MRSRSNILIGHAGNDLDLLVPAPKAIESLCGHSSNADDHGITAQFTFNVSQRRFGIVRNERGKFHALFRAGSDAAVCTCMRGGISEYDNTARSAKVLSKNRRNAKRSCGAHSTTGCWPEDNICCITLESVS